MDATNSKPNIRAGIETKVTEHGEIRDILGKAIQVSEVVRTDVLYNDIVIAIDEMVHAIKINGIRYLRCSDNTGVPELKTKFNENIECDFNKQ